MLRKRPARRHDIPPDGIRIMHPSIDALSAVVRMSTPTALAAVISFGTTPLLAHWYSPEEFGYAAATLSTASIVVNIFTLRLEPTLLRPGALDERKLTYTAIMASMLACWALTLTISLAALLAGRKEGAIYLALTGSTAAALAISSATSAVYTTTGSYFRVGMSRLIPTVATTAILFGLSNTSTRPLFTMASIQLFGLLLFATIATIDLRRMLVRTGALLHIKQHVTYISHAIPQGIAGQAGFLNLYLVASAALFDTKSAGILFMAFRLGGLPGNLISSPLSNYIASKHGSDDGRNYLSIITLLTILSLFIYMPFAFIGSFAIERILPTEWHGTISVFYAICILCAAQLAVGPAATLLLSRGDARPLLLWEIIRLTAIVGLLAFQHCRPTDLTTVTWLYALIQAGSYAALAALIISRMKHPRPPYTDINARSQQ